MAYGGNYSFEGLDARRAAMDGAIRDMTNMSRRFYPAIASRTPRRTVGNWGTNFGGVYFGDRELVVRDGGLYDDGSFICELETGEKQLAVLENILYIFPDNITYNVITKDVRRYYSISNVGEYTTKSVYIDYYYTDENTGGVIDRTYYNSGLAFKTEYFPVFPFKTGELIKIKITKIYRNGAYRATEFEAYVTPDAVSRETDNPTYGSCYTIKLPTETFKEINPNKIAAAVEIEVSFGIPDMDFVFASDNRLWGAKGRSIYASALGQGMVWIDYDTLATSSWAATTAAGDKITAAVDFGGMPVFFSENAVYKIYGENPKEYQYVRTEIIGVTEGEHKSVAVGAGLIFYLSRRGVYAWTGGIPQLISAPLGEDRLVGGVGGSDGAVYYLSVRQGGRHNLYVYDPLTSAWMREDDAHAVWMGMRGKDLCMVTDDGAAVLIGDVIGEDGTEETDIAYAMETADYNDGAVVQKSAKHILIQYELTDGTADVLVSHDGEPWRAVYTLYDTDGKKITSVIPLHPGNYRTMRIMIVGDGELIVYYMVREIVPMTERPGGEKNIYV